MTIITFSNLQVIQQYDVNLRSRSFRNDIVFTPMFDYCLTDECRHLLSCEKEVPASSYIIAEPCLTPDF